LCQACIASRRRPGPPAGTRMSTKCGKFRSFIAAVISPLRPAIPTSSPTRLPPARSPEKSPLRESDIARAMSVRSIWEIAQWKLGTPSARHEWFALRPSLVLLAVLLQRRSIWIGFHNSRNATQTRNPIHAVVVTAQTLKNVALSSRPGPRSYALDGCSRCSTIPDPPSSKLPHPLWTLGERFWFMRLRVISKRKSPGIPPGLQSA